MAYKVGLIQDRCDFFFRSVAGIIAFPRSMAQSITNEYYNKKNLYLSKIDLLNPSVEHFYFHHEKIDLSDLPDSYRVEELEKLAYELSDQTNVLPIRFSFFRNYDGGYARGEFLPSEMSLKLTTGIDLEDQDKNDLTIESYIEHELMHFVQFLLARRAEGTKRPPTKVNLPGYDNLIGYPYKGAPKDFEDIMYSPKTWSTTPQKGKQIMYELNPIEFYPKLNDAKSRYLSKSHQTLRTFKIFVGLIGKNPDYFFEYLKEHNPKVWRKAIKELWKVVEETINY